MSDSFGGRGVVTGQGWKRARQAAPLLLLLLAGCDSDRPYSGPPPGPPPQAQAAPAGPLGATPGASTSSTPTDPLLGDTKPVPSDPLLGQDPLQGRGVPTAHGHWLRGRLHDARVTVLLNGVQHGSFSGVLDQDITMKLRRGANTVTFVYQPQGLDSAADLEIVESEHDPPIAPLVTFHSTSVSAVSSDALGSEALKPVTQTFPFTAN